MFVRVKHYHQQTTALQLNRKIDREKERNNKNKKMRLRVARE